MAIILKHGQESSSATPLLVYTHAVLQDARPVRPGFVEDVESLEFQIVREGETVPVYPVAGDPLVFAPVNVLDDAPLGDRLSVGTYVAPVTVDPLWELGHYRVLWRAIVDGQTTDRWSSFRIIQQDHPIVSGYAQVADMLAEGVPAGFDVERIASELATASGFIDNVTNRFFTARRLKLSHDYYNSQTHRMFIPIIMVSRVEVNGEPRPDVTVYNRHIRQRMTYPDDREAPALVFDTPLSSPCHRTPQKVDTTGVFGYTDPDGSIYGRTPWEIRKVAMQIAMKGLRNLWQSTAGAGTDLVAGPVTSAKTRDQSITYANSAGGSGPTAATITTDWAIDQVLVRYTAPAMFTSF